MNLTNFWLDLLALIGAPRTDWGLTFLSEWARYEGTYLTNNNPLNTTLPYADAPPWNSVGVRAYPDPHTGAEATAQTLLASPGYTPIVNALRLGHPTPGLSQSLRYWGTGDTTGDYPFADAIPPYQPASLDDRIARLERIVIAWGYRPDGTNLITGTEALDYADSRQWSLFEAIRLLQATDF